MKHIAAVCLYSAQPTREEGVLLLLPSGNKHRGKKKGRGKRFLFFNISLRSAPEYIFYTVTLFDDERRWCKWMGDEPSNE
jgi:hypothetical protein